MTDKCLVSVVLMCYNQKEYIPQALGCILEQKCDYPMEIVVGDDGSKDGSRELFEEYQAKYPDLIRLVPKAANKGVLGNWRDSVNECKGKYVAVCHCDDFWHDPLKLQKEVNFLEENAEYGMVHTDSHFLLTSTNTIIEDYNKKHQPNVIDGFVFEDLISGKFFINTLTGCFRKSVYDKHVNVDEFIKAGFIYEDLPTWLEIARHSKLKYLPDSTATYRIMQNSISRPSDLTKRFGFLKNHYVIKKYFIEKYKVDTKIATEFEVMYHRKKFTMAYKWRNEEEAADSFSFLKGKDLVDIKLRIQKMFIGIPFLHSMHQKLKKLYVPKSAASQI
jgi:glycosyltransferase involved in cell wall biosynthesis